MKVSDDHKVSPRIDMVDLQNQYRGIERELREAFDEILSNTAFINGPHVKGFQQDLEKYLGANYVIPCGNGTDALQIALMALGLKPGDEVIVPSFTFVASVEVIGLLGMTPVLVDVDERTFNMDVDQLADAISEKTRAIMPVHLFGQCAEMERIMTIARDKGLFVVEDNAQSIGSSYTFKSGKTAMSGTIGDVGCLSFYPSKNLGCYGDGGAVISQHEKYGLLARSVANHGMATQRYYHERIGVNSRLDTLQAAVLQIKLRKLDQYIATRQKAADYYDQALAGLDSILTPVRSSSSTHVFHQYTIQLMNGERDALKEHLNSKGIPSMIYYPVPTQEQQAFKGLVRTPVSLDRTNALCKRVLSLPMHSELTEEQLEYICNNIRRFYAG